MKRPAALLAVLAACAPTGTAQLTVGAPATTTTIAPGPVGPPPSAGGPGPTVDEGGNRMPPVPAPSTTIPGRTEEGPESRVAPGRLADEERSAPSSATGAAMGDIEWLVRQTFPEDPDHAVAIAWCESRLLPDAGFPAGQNLGLMQIAWPVHAALVASMGYGHDDLANPIVNLAVARAIYDESGWAPWSCA